MTSVPDAPHPSAEQLATWDDTRDDPEVRAHLETCAACRQELLDQRALINALAQRPVDDVRSRAVAARAARAADRPSALFSRMWMPVAAAVGVAAVFVLSPLRSSPTDQASSDDPRAGAFVKRGAAEPPPPVQVAFYTAAGDSLRRLRPQDGLPVGERRVAAALSWLPGEQARHVVAYAKAADGRITWILPVWPSGAAPACFPLSASAGARDPIAGVELDAADGPLELTALLFTDRCDLAQLDARLEDGWQPPAHSVLTTLRLHPSRPVPGDQP